ncbi:MAG: carboxypeptidase M32, partial [Candidatus Zixiibacteriota bacterium]
RVEADEVTYNLHIILRFEMEHDLITEKLKPGDVPEAWNAKFQDFFGITPDNDALGCLQDVHWSAGLFGYFPTYALGNMYASQLFDQARADIPDLYGGFRAGEFGPLKKWLNEKIHSNGQRHPAERLIQVITGKPLSHAPIMNHLREKYGQLYGI